MSTQFGTEYHSILCRSKPDFLDEFLTLPILTRLSGVGLLCGTDYTPLFNNSFFYSRLEHSTGVALIIWNFTKDIRQTVAGLLHDVSTPAFSHVSDFKNGDALKQESTEDSNCLFIRQDRQLESLLKKYGIDVTDVENYHIYPVADNEIPGLSADRLEYMYPSGAALARIWSLKEIEQNYNDIVLYKNENGFLEPGFKSLGQAFVYAEKFIKTSLILQHNEDKIAMQLMADTLTLAEENGIIKSGDLYSYSEKEIIDRFDDFTMNVSSVESSSLGASSAGSPKKKNFVTLYKTFRSMKKIIRSDVPLSGCYNLSIDVKKRYVDPLVSDGIRLSSVDKKTERLIKDFLLYKDSVYGCVPYAD